MIKGTTSQLLRIVASATLLVATVATLAPIVEAASSCDADGDGFLKRNGKCNGTDCDDNDANVNPSATEVCNGIDDNCDGVADEGCSGTTPTPGGGDLICEDGPHVGQSCTSDFDCGVCAGGTNAGGKCTVDSHCPPNKGPTYQRGQCEAHSCVPGEPPDTPTPAPTDTPASPTPTRTSTPTATTEPCGNGTVEGDEECDDGNGVDLDGCSSTCKVETAPSCVPGMAASFTAAVSGENEWTEMQQVALDHGFDLTSLEPQTFECNEGYGITQWNAFAQPSHGNGDDAVVVYRPNLKEGLRIALDYVSGSMHDQYYFVTSEMTIHADGDLQTWEIIDRSGSVVANSNGTAAAAALAPAAPATPIPTYCDQQIATVWSCWADHLAALAASLFGEGVAVHHCIDAPSLATCGPALVYGLVLVYQSRQCGTGTQLPCLSKDCVNGRCFWDSSLGQYGCINIGSYACDAECNETCVSDNGIDGQCVGTKILTVSPDLLTYTDITVHCGIFAYCASPTDPWWQTVAADESYTPALTVSWCGKLKKGSAVFVTLQTTQCPSGWTCTQGPGYVFTDNMPNPVRLEDAHYCCAIGSGLPATFENSLIMNTGGILSNSFPFESQCVADSCTKCESDGNCTPIDAPVCCGGQ